MQTTLILFSSFGGLITSLYIFWKRTKGPMVCLIGENCDDVLQSKYATLFLGIPNELIGAAYFTALIVFYGITLFSPELFSVRAEQAVVFVTGLGALYALYLTGIQAFVLKKWCEKCLVLSFFTFLVFALVLLLG